MIITRGKAVTGSNYILPRPHKPTRDTIDVWYVRCSKQERVHLTTETKMQWKRRDWKRCHGDWKRCHDFRSLEWVMGGINSRLRVETTRLFTGARDPRCRTSWLVQRCKNRKPLLQTNWSAHRYKNCVRSLSWCTVDAPLTAFADSFLRICLSGLMGGG